MQVETRSGWTIKRTAAISCILFAAAVLIRLLFLWEYRSSPTFTIPIIDSASYDRMARILVEDGRFDIEFFWHGFLYPLFLSGIYTLTGNSISAARIFQAFLAGFTSLSVFFLAGMMFERRSVAVTASLITGFYGPLIFFDTALLATGLASLLAPLLIIAAIRTEGEVSHAAHAAFGVCAGLAVICRATFLPYVLAAIVSSVSMLMHRGTGWKRIVTKQAFAIAGLAVVLIPVAIASGRVTGHYSPLPRSGSINLYIGNNPDADRTMSSRPGAEWREILSMPERDGKATEKEYRRYFTDRFREYLSSQPLSFVAGLASKTARFFSSREIPRNYDIYTMRAFSKTLSALTWKAGKFGFPFGLLLPLAIIGLWTERTRLPSVFWLFTVIYPASVILVFSASRLRAPMIPVMAVPAAAGALFIVDRLRSKSFRAATAAVGVMIITAAAISLGGPYITEKHDYPAELHTSVAYQLSLEGKREEAVAELEKALELSPEFTAAHRILGLVLQEQGKNEEALGHLKIALEKARDTHVINYYMGVALLNLGRMEEGISHLEEAEEGARLARDGKLLRRVDAVLRQVR